MIHNSRREVWLGAQCSGAVRSHAMQHICHKETTVGKCFPCPIEICRGGYCRASLFQGSGLRPARTPGVTSSTYPVLL